MVTKDELITENELLKSQLKEATEGPEAPEGHTFVYIPSKGIDTTLINGKRHVVGSVNNEPFEIECNKQVAVPHHVAKAISGLLEQVNKH